MSELFDPKKHQDEIQSIINSNLPTYRQLLIDAGVDPQDIERTIQQVASFNLSGLRKAENFASLIKSLSCEEKFPKGPENPTGVIATAVISEASDPSFE